MMMPHLKILKPQRKLSRMLKIILRQIRPFSMPLRKSKNPRKLSKMLKIN
jgi:hypothetical protein